jgi:hypothetical protein
MASGCSVLAATRLCSTGHFAAQAVGVCKEYGAGATPVLALDRVDVVRAINTT